MNMLARASSKLQPQINLCLSWIGHRVSHARSLPKFRNAISNDDDEKDRHTYSMKTTVVNTTSQCLGPLKVSSMFINFSLGSDEIDSDHSGTFLQKKTN